MHEPARTEGHLSFYASPWTCYVDDEKVEAQEGDFYGPHRFDGAGSAALNAVRRRMEDV
jgi:hypothetical protein